MRPYTRVNGYGLHDGYTFVSTSYVIINPSSSVRIVKNAVRELNPFVRVSARTAGKLRPHYLGGGGQPRSLTLHRTTRGTLIPLSRTCYIHANRRKLSYGGESHTFIQ